jgi:hypothetical protein
VQAPINEFTNDVHVVGVCGGFFDEMHQNEERIGGFPLSPPWIALCWSQRSGLSKNLISHEVAESLRSADVDLDTQFIFEIAAERQNVKGMCVFVKILKKVHVTFRRVVASRHAPKHSYITCVVLGRKCQQGHAVRLN